MKPLLVRTGGHGAAKLATKSGGVARTVMAGTFASDEASGLPWSTFLAGAPLDKVGQRTGVRRYRFASHADGCDV
jgi:hypothetical protein